MYYEVVDLIREPQTAPVCLSTAWPNSVAPLQIVGTDATPSCHLQKQNVLVAAKQGGHCDDLLTAGKQ